MMDMFYNLPLRQFLALTASKIKYQKNGHFTQPILCFDGKKYTLFAKWFETSNELIEAEILETTLLELFAYSQGSSYDIKSDLPIIDIKP